MAQQEQFKLAGPHEQAIQNVEKDSDAVVDETAGSPQRLGSPKPGNSATWISDLCSSLINDLGRGPLGDQVVSFETGKRYS